MESYCNKTRIVSGRNILSALGACHPQRVLVVSDPFFFENGTAEQVAKATGAERTQIFSKVKPDPSVALAAEGTAFLKAFDPDLVVALGGGSAMDLAKAMVYFSGTAAPLAAVPTTSGSGSEVTDFAILTHENVKHPLVDPRLRPDLAVLDEALVEGLPGALVADGGYDAVSHALEAIAATASGAVTDALATAAFCDLLNHLPASFRKDMSARLPVHRAATMAGLAFTQSGLGMCHALSHSLGGMFHVPHGRLNAVLLPAVVGANTPWATEKYATLARRAGLGGSSDTMATRNLKNALIRLRRELKLPQTLPEAGIDPRLLQEKMDAIIAAALEDPCCHTNPRPVDGEVLRGVLQEVSHG